MSSAPTASTPVDDMPTSSALPAKSRIEDDEEIDITPMIDVTFLMLIFFLVASTPDSQTAIELAESKHGIAVSQLTSTIFTVAAGGLDIAPVYEADGKIEEFRLSEDPEKRTQQIVEAVDKGFLENKVDVVIKADKSVKTRQVDEVRKAVSKVEGIKINYAVLETN